MTFGIGVVILILLLMFTDLTLLGAIIFLFIMYLLIN